MKTRRMLTAEKAIFIHSAMSPVEAAALFAGLSSGGTGKLAEAVSSRQFPAEASVFEDSAGPALIWILRSGRARLIFEKKAGISREVKPGEICGLTEALAELPYSATLVAETPCRFDVIESGRLFELLAAEPAFCLSALRLLGTNFREAYFKALNAG